MNTLTIHKTTYASTNYGWLEYGLECRIGNAEIHRIFSSSPIHCALDYKIKFPVERKEDVSVKLDLRSDNTIVL